MEPEPRQARLQLHEEKAERAYGDESSTNVLCNCQRVEPFGAFSILGSPFLWGSGLFLPLGSVELRRVAGSKSGAVLKLHLIGDQKHR